MSVLDALEKIRLEQDSGPDVSPFLSTIRPVEAAPCKINGSEAPGPVSTKVLELGTGPLFRLEPLGRLPETRRSCR